MKKISLFLLLFTGFAGISLLQSCQSTKTATTSKMLKFNFEKGKGYDYEMIMSMDQEMMGQKLTTDMTMYYSMNVVDEGAEGKTIQTTYDRFKLSADVGGMNIDVDTDKPMVESGKLDPEKNPVQLINRVLGAIRGKQFTLKISPEGKVLEINGLRELSQSLIDSMGIDEQDPEVKKKMKEAFDMRFNDEEMKNQFERVLYIFPNKEVKVGDSWQKNSVLKTGGMPSKYNSTYTVKEIEGDMVTLEEDSKIVTDDDKIRLEGGVEGTIVVDSRSGLIVSANQDMDITVKAEGMSIKVKGITKVKGKAN